MTKCSPKNCANDTRSTFKKDGLSYFSFPRNPIRCFEWVAIIARARDEEFYKPNKGSVVCSDHFSLSDIYTTVKGFRRLVKSAKPILRLRDNNGNNDNVIQEPVQIDKEIIVSSHDDNLEKLTPSTSSSTESILDTPREVIMKKKVNLYEKNIKNKNKQVNRLQKQNKRLSKKNISLKNALSLLKKTLQQITRDPRDYQNCNK